MQVSAINNISAESYVMTNGSFPSVNSSGDKFVDTSFNSLTPYNSKKTVSEEKLPMVFDSVNQWKNFCHRAILGAKLDITA